MHVSEKNSHARVREEKEAQRKKNTHKETQRNATALASILASKLSDVLMYRKSQRTRS